MRKWKRFAHGVLAAALSVCMMAGLAPCANASDGGYTRPEIDRETSLSIHYHQKALDFSGVDFRIYKIADMTETVKFGFTERFEDYPVSFQSEMTASDWVNMAELLAGYVSRDNLKPDYSGTTDKNGMYQVPDLDAGLYLVMGGSHQREYRTTEDGESVLHRVYYHTAPFLVATPNLENTGWVYDVEVSPKFTASEDEFISRRVLKTWDDAGYESRRPGVLTFDLVRDDEVYETVELTADNLWRYQWDELDNTHQWRIVEHVSGNYRVSARQEGVTYVVTNSYIRPYTPPPVRPDPPTQDPPSIPTPPTDIPDDDPPLIDEPDIPDDPEVTDKPEVPDEPDTPPTDIPDEDPPLAETPLPQTGQLWWPVPVMAATGCALFCIGWVLYCRLSKKQED